MTKTHASSACVSGLIFSLGLIVETCLGSASLFPEAGAVPAGMVGFYVNPWTGDVWLTGGTGATISSYEIDSASGSLDHTKWVSLGAGMTSLNSTDFSIAEGTLGTGPSLSGSSADLGAVFRIGGTHDLELMAFDNAGNEIDWCPEPASLTFLGLAAVALTARRRLGCGN